MDILTLFENAVNSYFQLYFSDFMDYVHLTFGVIMTFYWLFHIITGVIDQSDRLKSLAGSLFLVVFASTLTMSPFYEYWIVDVFRDLRLGMISFFMGDDASTTWDLVSNGLTISQEMMKEDDEWVGVGASMLYGGFMFFSFFSVYVMYCVVYLGALIPLLVLQFLGGVVLMLASLPSFRGIAKLWLQAMSKYTLICILSSVLVAIAVGVVDLSAETELVTDDGYVTQTFLVILIAAWITRHFLPKSAEIASDLIGGGAPSSAGDAGAGAQAADAMKGGKMMDSLKKAGVGLLKKKMGL